MRYDARFRTAWEWVIFPLKAWFRTLHLGQNLAAVVSRVHVFCSLKDTQEAVEQPTSKLLCSMLSQIWEQGRMDQDWTVNGDLSAKRGKWSLMRTSTWKPPFLRCGVRWRTLSNNAHITRGKCLILLFIMVNEKDPSMGSPMQIIMAILYDDCNEGWLLTIVTPTFFSGGRPRWHSEAHLSWCFSGKWWPHLWSKPLRHHFFTLSIIPTTHYYREIPSLPNRKSIST